MRIKGCADFIILLTAIPHYHYYTTTGKKNIMLNKLRYNKIYNVYFLDTIGIFSEGPFENKHNTKQ